MIKILVIDDDPFTTQILELTFRGQDCVMRVVNDSLQAVDAALSFLPDIILMDIMMPVKDGIEVCRELRSHASMTNTNIIMLTGAEDMGKRIAAFQAGATEFMTKPFHPREFREQIHTWAGKRS